jgi:hypothetical protein
MPRQRRTFASDRETLTTLVAVLTPLARRLATDRELRDELRSAAETVNDAYRKARSSHPGSHHATSRVHAYEENGARGYEYVDAEIVDAGARGSGRSRLVRAGLAAGAIGTAAAILGSRHTGPRVKKTLGRIVGQGRGPRDYGL